MHITGSLSSLCYDWQMRQRISGANINSFFVMETSIPLSLHWISILSSRLNLVGRKYASLWTAVNRVITSQSTYKKIWALTPHERLRLRCMIDAIVASLYGLNRDDFAWILKDCDHPTTNSTNRNFCKRLDPKGFWRVDKIENPELRHTVLSLKAFDDLQIFIEKVGDRDAGIEAFCEQNDGDGWKLPETLCIKDLGMTRSFNIDIYDLIGFKST